MAGIMWHVHDGLRLYHLAKWSGYEGLRIASADSFPPIICEWCSWRQNRHGRALTRHEDYIHTHR